jgi:WD domain, G-beta repeat
MNPFARRVRAACAAVAVVVAAQLAAAQPVKPVEVPPAAEVTAAVETLRDVYDKDYSAAEKDAKAKRALAQKLFDGAAKRKTVAMVFASFDEARRLAAAGGDVKLATAALGALQQRFALPGPFFRDTLKQLADSDLPAADAPPLSKLARDEAASALDREDYDGAVELAGIAAAAAKKAQDPDLAIEQREYRARVEALRKAVATVKSQPDDPEANAALGAYWAFDRNRWDTGLKYLAKGSDKSLAEAAAKELAQPKSAKDRTAAADLWYKLSKEASGDRKRQFAERAWEWYSAAVAVAQGDDDFKPVERAKEIEKAYPGLFDTTLEGHTAAAAVLAVTRDGRTLVSVGNDNSVRVWDTATGKLQKTLDGHTAWVGSLAVTPDGSKAYTAGGDNVIRVWDLKTGKQTDALEGHTVAIRGLAMTADGKFLVSGASDKTCRMWDLTTNKEVKKYGDGKESVESVAVSPDGSRVLAGSDSGVVTVYDAKTAEVVAKFDKHGTGTMVYTIVVTKDGKYAISGARDKEIRVWEVATGKQIRTMTGHTEQVYQVALSPDEKQVLSASYDRTVRVWDFATGRELKKFEGHTDGVQGVCYAPDGRTAYSASWDKNIRRWRIPAALSVPAPVKKID